MPIISAVILVSAVKQTCIQFTFAKISTGYGTVFRYLGLKKKLQIALFTLLVFARSIFLEIYFKLLYDDQEIEIIFTVLLFLMIWLEMYFNFFWITNGTNNVLNFLVVIRQEEKAKLFEKIYKLVFIGYIIYAFLNAGLIVYQLLGY